MVRTQYLVVLSLFTATVVAGCQQASYEGCSGPGGENVAQVVSTMLDAVEQQSSNELCSLFQVPSPQEEADALLVQMQQSIAEHGGRESIAITQVDQGGSSKEFEMTDADGKVFAEFSIFQNSGREFLSISVENFTEAQ
ncbi:hypothetical protein [Timonella sp. A28]|uniref:hypothetical protein n=1 Tax=Timonella sp. A28 TaxID=3442640 RepID=UPI003EC09F0B